MRTLFAFLARTFFPSMENGAFSPPTPDIDYPEHCSIGPNGVILLVPGRMLTVAGGKDGPPTVVEEGPAGPNPNTGVIFPDHEVNKNSDGEGFIPPSGQVTFKLWVEADATFILIENGHHEPMIFITHLVEARNGILWTEPTPTCAVRARGAGLESRNFPVKAVRIVGIRWVTDDELCLDPATGRAYKLPRR